MIPVEQRRLDAVIGGLDRWFQSMRTDWPTRGFGGPVVHWWSWSREYRGAGLDWRYEGIIDGYLTLWSRTGDRVWLERATQAGDDLLAGQQPEGTFVNSRFELNPGTGGTPHEAAADVGLLLLAEALANEAPERAAAYLAVARRNLESYWLGRLWHAPSSTLWDDPAVASFVPNKAATFLDALLRLAALTGDDGLIERHALPTGRQIVEMQVRAPGQLLDGAIAQNRFGERVVEAYFPLYIARCVPPLLALAQVTGDADFRDAALAATRFVARTRERDGGFPQVLYARGRRNRNPRWIAGAGDMLRAFQKANELGGEIDCEPTIRWILNGARADGRIATAEGFGRVAPPLVARRAGIGDELGVVGWCDKAFRALVSLIEPSVGPGDAGTRATDQLAEASGAVR